MTNNLIPIQQQIALFLEDFHEDQISGLFAKLIQENSEFDDLPVSFVFPAPSDAPREIPLMILRSNDDVYTLEFSLDKLLLSEKLKKGKGVGLENCMSLAKKVYEQISQFQGKKATISRVGYIQKFLFFSRNPISELSQNIIATTYREKMRNFDIRLTYDVELDTFKDSNQYITIANGSTGDDRKILLIQNDINTKPEFKAEMTIQKAEKFIHESYGKYFDTEELKQKFLNE